jgi:antitoxin component of MazEF toxin-antitoxin module
MANPILDPEKAPLPFKTKVRKQGGARITTLPKKVLEEVGIQEGDEVSISSDGENIIIQKSDTQKDRFLEAHEYSLKRFSKAYEDLAK